MRYQYMLALLLVLLAAPGLAAQQTTTGSISGRVVDSQNLPVPGATVTVVSPQGDRTFTTDADGRFFAPYLTPGQYEIKVELSGFRQVDRKDIQLRVGQAIDLTLPMTVGELTETVQVSAETPVIDTTSTTTGATLDSELLSRIPVGRRFSDSLYLAPGVSSGGQVGQANPSIAGGSGLENSYVVDGVNITNGGYGALGSYSIVFGSLGNGLPFDFIKSAQVKTGGYEAEYGQATGGVVNVVTKSGSNRLTGSLFGYFRPDSFEASRTPGPDHQRHREHHRHAGGRLGRRGRRSDRAEQAVLLRRGGRTDAIAPTTSRRTASRSRVSDRWPRIGASCPTRPRPRGRPTPTQRVDVSFFGDPAHGDLGPQRYTALLNPDTAAYSTLDQYGGNNQTVRYEGAINKSWLIEGSFARAANNIVEIPSVDQWSVTDDTVTPHQPSGGIGFYEVGNQSTNWQYGAKATNLIGRHQIRYGIDAEHLDYINTINRTGPTFTLPDGTMTATGAEIEILPDPTYGKIYRVVRANTRNVRRHVAELRRALRAGHLEDPVEPDDQSRVCATSISTSPARSPTSRSATSGRRGLARRGIPPARTR